MRNRTRALDRLPARRVSTERIVRFVVMITAERLPIIYIELLIWEGLLITTDDDRDRKKIKWR